MKHFCRRLFHISLAFTAIVAVAQDTVSTPRPYPAEVAVPPLTSSRAEPFCIECMPFDTKTHKQILEDLVSNIYIGELRRALYMQDVIHQFESKAHFDNCDFDDALNYIKELLTEVGQKVALAKSAQAIGDTLTMQTRIKEAFFALGQAIHGTQDFYAHTNYVEMNVDAAKKTNDFRIIPVWTAAGEDQTLTLAKQGLKSGYVFWGFPQKCSTNSPSHAELAKDSEQTKSGKVRIPHLQNTSQYTLAQALARRASVELVSYAFKQWPLLQEVNGETVAFEILLDQRDIK